MNKVLSILLTVLLPVALIAQPTFKKKFGTQGIYDAGSGIIQLKSKEFIVIGATAKSDPANPDVYCVKLDANGKTLWEKSYGTTLKNESAKAIPTLDGGFVLCFTSYTLYYNKLIFIVKCDKEGTILWSKCHKSAAPLLGYVSLTPYCIYESREGDIYVLTDWSGSGSTFPEFSLLKMSAGGEFRWNTPVSPGYRLGNGCYCSGLTESDNGEMIVAENTTPDDFYFFGAYLRLYRISKETGIVIQIKAINQEYKNDFAYISASRIASKGRKVFVEGRYSSAPDYGTFWMAVGADDRNVKAYFDNEAAGKQAASGGANDTLLYRIKKALEVPPPMTKDGGTLSVSSTQDADYDVIIEKRDSLGRICPDYALPVPVPDDKNLQKTFFDATGDLYVVLDDTFILTDSTITVTNLSSEEILCEGSTLR